MNDSKDADVIARHTPGPWRIDEDGMQVIGFDDKPVCEMGRFGEIKPWKPFANHESNGVLIAAAPEMLLEICDAADAIDEMVEWIERVALPALGDDSDGGGILCEGLKMKADELRAIGRKATAEAAR